MFFATVPKHAVFRFDAFSVWTGVFVVINLAMFRRIFWRVRMVWIYFCHTIRRIGFHNLCPVEISIQLRAECLRFPLGEGSTAGGMEGTPVATDMRENSLAVAGAVRRTAIRALSISESWLGCTLDTILVYLCVRM